MDTIIYHIQTNTTFFKMRNLEIGDLIVNIFRFKQYEQGTTFRIIGFGDISHMIGVSRFPTLGYCITQNGTNWEYISNNDTNFIEIDKWYAERKKIIRDQKIDKILS